jgi:hypothetical protein
MCFAVSTAGRLALASNVMGEILDSCLTDPQVPLIGDDRYGGRHFACASDGCEDGGAVDINVLDVAARACRHFI